MEGVPLHSMLQVKLEIQIRNSQLRDLAVMSRQREKIRKIRTEYELQVGKRTLLIQIWGPWNQTSFYNTEPRMNYTFYLWAFYLQSHFSILTSFFAFTFPFLPLFSLFSNLGAPFKFEKCATNRSIINRFPPTSRFPGGVFNRGGVDVHSHFYVQGRFQKIGNKTG